MLLVSSLTPSGRAWALESAIASFPEGRVIEAPELLNATDFGDLFRAWGVRDARSTSMDLAVSIESFRNIAMVVVAFERSASLGQRAIVWIPGSVSALLADLQAVCSLMDLSALPDLDTTRRCEAVMTAVRSGAIEWLVACPPEESAAQALCGEVAVASALGMRMRGVCVAPMPRKTDGWPKSVRADARDAFHRLENALHPLPISRAKRGFAPVFDETADLSLAPAVAHDAQGEWIWSVTLPGLSMADVQVGSWSADVSYPVTHIVLRINHTTVRVPVDATLRRCEATHAVVAGDSVAVTFVPEPQQWPRSFGEGGEDE